MSYDYIEINKTDLTLALAWIAAVCAWYAWREASSAHYHAKPDRDPITVEPADDSEDQDGE